MSEHTLFDIPLAHSNDPVTSFKAAEQVQKSGKFQYSVNQVREAIIRYQRTMMRPDFTAKELAAYKSKRRTYCKVKSRANPRRN